MIVTYGDGAYHAWAFLRYTGGTHPFYAASLVDNLVDGYHTRNRMIDRESSFDPVMYLIAGWRTKSMLGPFSLHSEAESRIIVRHHAPYNFKLSFAEDTALFGSVLGNLGRSLSVLSDKSNIQKRFEAENCVNHSSTRGIVYPAGTSFYIADDGSANILGTTCPKYKFVNSPYVYADNWQLTGAQSAQGQVHFLDILLALDVWISNNAGPHIHEDAGGGTYHDRTFLSFDYEIRDSSVILTYEWDDHYYKSSDPLSKFTRATIWSRIECRWLGYRDLLATQSISAQSSQNLSRYRSTPWMVINEISITNSSHTDNLYPILPHVDGSSYVEQPSWAIISAKMGANEPSDSDLRDLKTAMVREYTRVNYVIRDVYPSAYVTAAGAIANHREIVNNNFVESMLELDALLHLFPDLGPIQKFLELVPKGKFILGALRLVDFAANTYLLYQYGLKPAYEDIKTFAKGFDRITRKLRERLRGDLTLRGKFIFEFDDDDENFPGYRLLARSKVVITFPREAVMMSLLTFEATGTAPYPSNLWDAIPFSFVVDWFTNNSERWRLGQAAVHAFFAQTHYCVHSYTLVRPLSEVLPVGFTASSDATFRFYSRLASSYFPGAPSHNEYDWGAQVGGVPKLAAGALLWSIFRK